MKNLDWTPVEVRRWVMNDNTAVKDVQTNRKTLNSFIAQQIVKFRQGLDVQERGEACAGPQYPCKK